MEKGHTMHKMEKMHNHEEMREKHKEMKEKMQENRTQMRENRKMHHADHKDMMLELKETLTQEQKEALENMHEMMQEEMQTLREKMEDAETMEEKEAIKEEMDTLVETHHESLKKYFSDNQEALEILEARMKTYEKNEILRQENKELRKDYVGAKREMVEKYKTTFLKRLEGRLDKMPEERLEEVSQRIDAMLEKYENNEDMSHAKKEAMISALIALKEIIEEKMEEMGVQDDVTETIESILE